MPYQEASKKAVRFLVCFCVLTAAPFCLATASAQEQSESVDAERAAQFRKMVIKKWAWEPRKGVALTTTHYAREYVGKWYLDERGWFPKQYAIDGRVSIGDLTKSRIVLFQTSALDIVAVPSDTRHVEYHYVVFRRSSHRLLYAGMNQSTGYEHEARFIDVDGVPPQELEILHSFQDPGRFGGVHAVHELSRDFKKLFFFKNLIDAELCPSMQLEGAPTWTSAASGSKADRLEGRVKAMLRLEGACDPPKYTTTFDMRCSFDTKEKSFMCKKHVVKATKVKLRDLRSGDKESTAANLEFVSKNAEMLKESGFRLPEELLDEPDSSERKSE